MRIDKDQRAIISDTGHTAIFFVSKGDAVKLEAFQHDIAGGCLSEEDRELWFLASGTYRDEPFQGVRRVAPKADPSE